jgi:hypothetical protein
MNRYRHSSPKELIHLVQEVNGGFRQAIEKAEENAAAEIRRLLDEYAEIIPGGVEQFDGDLLMERIHSDFLEQFDVVEDYLYVYFGKNSN